MRKSLLATGVTLAALGASALLLAPTASASTSAPYIRYGSSGAGVTCVQKALAFGAGLLTPSDVDGQDGPKTTTAIREYQANVGIPVDGIVGPQTGDHLMYDEELIGLYSACYPYIPTSS